MKRCVHIGWIVLLLSAEAGMAQEAGFSRTRLMALEGKREKLVSVTLHFSATSLVLTDKKTSQARLDIPYSRITGISYEKAKRHRKKEGAALAGLSLGGGLILMATKTESHWLAIEYGDGGAKQTAVLQLHKDEVDQALKDCEAKSGKKIEFLAATEHKINVTADSRDMDEVVNYPSAQVQAALTAALEKYSCAITARKAGEIKCKRAKTSDSEIAGIGGERITARFEAKGASTRIRIDTSRGFNGKFAKKNWSTPVFRQMMNNLKGSAANAFDQELGR